MAAADRAAVADEVWRGCIPVCLRSGGEDRPLYAMVPRLAYLPTLEAQLARHFREAPAPAPAPQHDDGARAPSLADSDYFAAVSPSARSAAAEEPRNERREETGLWFCDGAGAPVPWDMPLGAALDAAALAGPVALPWELGARFRGAPADHVACEEQGCCFKAFYHALKQAVHLERGTARAALTLPRVDQEALWAALNAGDRGAFAARDLAPVDAPRHVPVRLLFRGCPPVQLPLAPVAGDGAPATLATALGPAVEARLGVAVAACVAVAHGVALPWDMELLDAWRNLHYGDHFLYLAVARRPP